MTTDALDPVIYALARLRIVATLAAVPDGDTLSFTRLQDMLDLTPANLITHLRKLEDAAHLTSEKIGNGQRHAPRSHRPAAPGSTPTPAEAPEVDHGAAGDGTSSATVPAFRRLGVSHVTASDDAFVRGLLYGFAPCQPSLSN